jgi:hypothetical protein
MVARVSEHPLTCKKSHPLHEAECRSDAVASVLAALVLGVLERDDVLEVELARLAEQAHRHICAALREAA